MKLHEITQKIGRKSKRIGRGIGSKRGKTAGQGTKGQKSRTGGGVRPGFEGGQTPLIRRIPKLKGFKSRNPKAKVINLDDLNKLPDGAKINEMTLVKAGLILSGQKYKILNSGSLEKKLTLDTESVSKEARKAVEKYTKEAKKAQ